MSHCVHSQVGLAEEEVSLPAEGERHFHQEEREVVKEMVVVVAETNVAVGEEEQQRQLQSHSLNRP